ncbi:MAG: FG-GAP-like repeat-containing protein [Gammaproteobacteria bacterium]|nr:FG-GAP-like repeat-containing protein [Gammaproteobacteria bacterium]
MKFVPIKIEPRSGWLCLLAGVIALAALPATAQHRAVQLTPGLATSFTDFGKAVSTAGDVNNDGYDDMIVGQPNSGRVYVYYGSATGQFASQSGSVGTPDWQDTVNAGNFGSALAAGDFNCDGIDDIAVGAYDGNAGQFREGQVYVYYGSVTGLAAAPDWRAESDATNAWFGWSVSNAGDVNKDGCSDLLIGGRRSGNGTATLIFGGDGAGGPAPLPDADADGVARPSDFSWSVSGTGGLGQSVAGIGDVNNDTVDDILIGSRNGNIYIYYGVSAGVPNTIADWSDSGFGTFGRSVAKAGKINGDTVADFIVGAPTSNGGVVHLYYGATGGARTDGNSDWNYTVPSEGHSHGSDTGFAATISAAGNVNGDGYDDFIVGWPVYHGGLTGHLGRVYLFHGGASGPAATPDETIDGAQEGAQFGISVSAGNFDGDTLGDFIVGASSYSVNLGATITGTGTTFAYLSTPAPAHITIDPPQSYTNFHLTSEDGITRTSSFSLVLDRLPGADVTINISSNNPAEGVVLPATLTFTVADWNVPQVVNITGVDDMLADGTVPYTLSFAVNSSDADYNGLIVDEVTARNEDDDVVAIIVDPTMELVTTEDLGTAAFTVVLDAQPTANVTIDLTSTNLLEGTIFPASVTFDTVNFRDPQGVTITGVDDAILDGNIAYTIITAPAVSSDPSYNNFNPADVEVTNHDNDLNTSTIILEGNQIGSLFGRTVSAAGDINGDGFADFIVGAPKHDNGQSNEGRVYVYFGAPEGFSSTPWSAEVDQARAEFGGSVASAGDVNGDGFADIIVGARKYDGGEDDEGRVFVYYGSAEGLPATPDWMAEIDQAGANFGAAVSSAGDVNGDGFDDILVGADNYYAADFVSPGADFPLFVKEGAAFLFYGSASGLPDAVLDGIARLSDGDVAWQGETGGVGAVDTANYGRAVGSAGDVNCDGFADIIVGAPKYNLVSFSGLWGRVWVYHGGPSGLRSDGNADWTMLGPQESTSFGSAVDGAGNVNGDTQDGNSCDDVIIGADGFESTNTGPTGQATENNEGRVYLYYGSPTGLTTTPWTYENNQANGKLGIASATVGDLNNDGFADIIAGANRYDGGETDEGRIYIYFGSASGPGNPVTREINQASALFGTAVAGTGDVDGDGNDDFIVGATLYDGDLLNEGAAFLYLSDQPAIKVYPAAGLITTETGGSDSFSVVLTDAPTTSVTIGLSSDLTEGTLSSSSLLFTPADWFTPQTVTVTGVDDGSIDGGFPYTVVTAAAVSMDSRYSGMNGEDVAVLNLDDERSTVSIIASDGAASESGPDSGTFTVSRTGGTPSPLLLFYTVGGTATNGLDYQSLNGSVTIAAGSSSAVITLTPLLDGFFEASETVIVTLSVAASYTVGVPASASVTISDGTANGITISPTSGLVTTEQGGNDTFTIVLNSLPTADVTINFTSDTPGEGSPLVSGVTFTTANWDTPQIVTVVGQDDAVVDGDAAYTIVTSVTSSDSNYAALNPADVAVINRDNDALPVVTIVTRSDSVSEGGLATFRVARAGSTASNLVVNYNTSGTATSGIDYTTPSGTVTILGGQSFRDVNLTTTRDPDPEGPETITLSLIDSAIYIVGSPRADSATIRNTSIIPVSFGSDQIVAEGTTVRVPVVKREAERAVTITYTVAGSAENPADHDAMDGSILVAGTDTTGYITFNTAIDELSEEDETVVFTIQSLSPSGGFGNKTIHTVTITDANLRPATTFRAVQGGLQTHLVVASSGFVTMTASVADPNPDDSHSYDWSLTNNNLIDDDLDGDPATFVFDPSGLMPGFYKARITVTDDGSPVLAVTNELLLEVVATAPTLGAFTDTDGDGVRDATESYDDSDGDGIPDYLDPNAIAPIPDRNLPLDALQQLPVQYKSYVMRTDPGLALRLGDIAFLAGNGSARVSVADIANFGDGEGGPGAASAQDIIPNSGGYFDFEITSLPIAGRSASVVIPQFEPLPSGAQYRKYHPVNGWNNFVEDANNSLSSAPGIPGLCPMPRDAAYTPGLTVGDFCVQLIIEDGGPNDTDGIANHVIEDPGQIGVVESPPGGGGEPPPVVTEQPGGNSQSSQSGGGGIINLTVMLGLFLFIWFSLRTSGRRTGWHRPGAG